MLGIVFTEFAEMVETAHSPELLDNVLDACAEQLATGGAYTAVGNYDHTEMLVIVTELSRQTEIPVPDLVRAYGKHLFGVFTRKYPMFFNGVSDTMSFMERVETHIHHEVLKLYHTAELPHLHCSRNGTDGMQIEYSSSRPFSVLALGLIEGCAEHFGETVQIEYEDLSGGAMTRARFDLTKH